MCIHHITLATPNNNNNNGLFDLAATAGLVTKITYIHIEPK